MATVTRRMACPPAAVMDVLRDGWSYATWVVGTARIRGVDPRWPEPGARIAHSAGVWPLLIDDETVVSHWDPDGRLELRARGWPAGEAQVRIDVRPSGDGCAVRIVEDAVAGPATLVPGPLRRVAITLRNTETLTRLAALAERPSPGAAGT